MFFGKLFVIPVFGKVYSWAQADLEKRKKKDKDDSGYIILQSRIKVLIMRTCDTNYLDLIQVMSYVNYLESSEQLVNSLACSNFMDPNSCGTKWHE